MALKQARRVQTNYDEALKAERQRQQAEIDRQRRRALRREAELEKAGGRKRD